MVTNFPAKPAYNLGGYTSFKFSPYQFIYDFPLIAAGAAASAIVFTAGYTWHEGYATQETLSYTEEPQSDDGGQIYNITISGFVPGESPQLVDLVESMALDRYVLLIRDSSGQLRLAGSAEAPLDFSASFGSGAARQDLKGFNIKFSGQSKRRAPGYDF